MSRRRMRDARQPALAHQAFVGLRPQRHGSHGWSPVGISGLVTPLSQTRHNLGMRTGAAKCLHGVLAFPRCQRPEGATGVYEESATEKPRCAHDLALTEKSHPQERRKIPHGANPKARNRCEHNLVFYLERACLRMWLGRSRLGKNADSFSNHLSSNA